MGDLGDYWREHKEYKREQKQKFGRKIPDVKKRVEDAGHDIRQLSHDHYRVDNLIDWWPTTGTWRYKDGRKLKGGSKNGWGVKDLLKELAAQEFKEKV